MLLGKYDRPNRERPPAKRDAALGFDRLEPHDRKVRIGAADRNPEVDHRSPHSTFAGRTPAQTFSAAAPHSMIALHPRRKRSLAAETRLAPPPKKINACAWAGRGVSRRAAYGTWPQPAASELR